MGERSKRKGAVVFFAFLLFITLLPAFSPVECNIGGTVIACPFDFSAKLSEICLPANLNNSVRVDVNFPGNFTPDSQGTYLAGGGTLYKTFYQEGASLFFPAPKIAAGSFSTRITINGITANTTDSLTAKACPCVLDRKGFSVKYDDETGRQILQGSVSGSSGCKTDGSVVYKTTLFISRAGVPFETIYANSAGDYFEAPSVKIYSSDDPLSFQVAVTDAASGTVYGLFPPEVLKPNDFSIRVDSPGQIKLSSGTRTDVRLNITNKGSITEYYELSFEGLPTGWQTSSTTTRALSPGETGIFSLSISPAESPLSANATISAKASGTQKTKSIPVSFSVAKTILVFPEAYTSVFSVPAGEEFDVTTLIRVSGSAPTEKVYWTIVPEPYSKMGVFPHGKMSAFGTQTYSNKTFFQKLACKGSPNLRKLWLVLHAVLENPSMADSISAGASGLGNGTGLETDVSNFISSKNKSVAAGTLLSKVAGAEEKALANCTLSEGSVSLYVFSLSTLNGATFESERTAVQVSGKRGSFFIEAIDRNISIPKGGTGNATMKLTSNFPSEKQVSLRTSGTTSFRVEFPGGTFAKIPSKGSLVFNVSVSDRGTIVKPNAEPIQIEATTTDVTGEPIVASAQFAVSVRSALVELVNPFSSQTKLEQGGNKTIELKFRNIGPLKERFSFSPAGPVKITPDALEIEPGKSQSVNFTISLSEDVVEGSKIATGVTVKSESTGEETLYKTDILVVSSEKARLKKNIDGIIDEIQTVSADCRFYNLNKLTTLANNARERLEKGELTTAKSYYTQALNELDVAEVKCQKPDSAATLLVLGGLGVVGGAGYYFIVYKKKFSKPPQKPQGYIGGVNTAQLGVGYNNPYLQQQQQPPAPPQQPQQGMRRY